MEGLKHLDFTGKDIGNGNMVTGKMEVVRWDDGTTTLVLNTGFSKAIVFPDTVTLAEEQANDFKPCSAN